MSFNTNQGCQNQCDMVILHQESHRCLSSCVRHVHQNRRSKTFVGIWAIHATNGYQKWILIANPTTIKKFQSPSLW
jgi:hypothetical protein